MPKETAADPSPRRLVGHPRLDSAPSNGLRTGPGPLRASVERSLDAAVQFGGAIREAISTVGQSPSSAPSANPSQRNHQVRSRLTVRPRRPHQPSTSPAQEIANSTTTRTRPDPLADTSLQSAPAEFKWMDAGPALTDCNGTRRNTRQHPPVEQTQDLTSPVSSRPTRPRQTQVLDTSQTPHASILIPPTDC